jgi:hypothetical protein
MRVEEKHPCKVLIDVTRSADGDRQEVNGVRTIRVDLTIMSYLYFGCLVPGTVRLWITGSHCDIHQECVRRDPIVFSTWYIRKLHVKEKMF